MKKEKIYEYIENNQLNIEDIVKDYSNYVQTIIKNKTKMSQEDIEEIISDVFVTLWNNQDKLNINNKMSSYIAGITKNLIKKKYRDIKEYENIDDLDEKFIISENITLYSSLEEQYDALLNELNKSKKEDQKVFSMYYFENRKIKEISKLLNFSESKIKMKLNRTRKKLSKLLKERDGDCNG